VSTATAVKSAPAKAAWHSAFTRHKPGRARTSPPPRLSDPPLAHHARLGRSPHMKHNAAVHIITARPHAAEPAPKVTVEPAADGKRERTVLLGAQ